MATIRQKANRLADQGLNEAEDDIENVRGAKNRLNRRYASQLDDTEGNLSNMAEDMGRELRETYDSGMEYLHEGADTARRTVQKNPLLALAGAFVGGMVASALFRR